jgi:protein-L-isoaspartate(D-aspartate) O-methyltransferase
MEEEGSYNDQDQVDFLEIILNTLGQLVNIDRGDFVLPEFKRFCYEDHPLSIGEGQTISQPSTVAFMLELLDPQPGQQILDIGCGSGYTSALLAYLVGQQGNVTGVEIKEKLVELAKSNLHAYVHLPVNIYLAGRKPGLPGEQFDRILVSAAAETFPYELLDQLKEPGRLVIPILNSIYLYEKAESGEIITKEHYGFVFVPLIVD